MLGAYVRVRDNRPGTVLNSVTQSNRPQRITRTDLLFAFWSGARVRFDGGEYPALAGEFSGLRQLSKEQWDQIEKAVRTFSAKQKEK